MADNKPKPNLFNLSGASNAAANLFKNNSSNSSSLFPPTKNEKDKESPSQANEPVSENAQPETFNNVFNKEGNLFGNSGKGSSAPISNPSNIFEMNTSGAMKKQVEKKNLPFNVFQNSKQNPFAQNLQKNFFQLQARQKTSQNKEANLSLQPNQSNSLFEANPNPNSLQKFSLSQKTPQSSKQSKGLFDQTPQPSKRFLFSSNPTEEKKTSNVFASVNQNPGSLFSSNPTEEKKTSNLLASVNLAKKEEGHFTQTENKDKINTSLFGQDSQAKNPKNVESSTAVEQKKPSLFGQVSGASKLGEPFCSTNLFGIGINTSKTGGLFSSNESEPKNGSLFEGINAKQKIQANALFSTSNTLQSNQTLKDSSQQEDQALSEENKKLKAEQKPQKLEKKSLLNSIIKQEDSEEEINQIPSQNLVSKIDQRLAKSRQILDYLKKIKEENQEIILRPQTKDYYEREIQIIEEKLRNQKNKHQDLKSIQNDLTTIKKEKQDKIKELQSKHTDFSFRIVIKPSENNQTNAYPNNDKIEQEIREITDIIKDYYEPGVGFQQFEIQKENKSEELLRKFHKKMDNLQKTIGTQTRDQNDLITSHAKTLRKIELLRSFGKFMDDKADEPQKTEAYAKKIKQELEEQLTKLKRQNEEKRAKYEGKRAQVRKNSPSQKIATGCSSIIMKSTIYE